MRCKYLVAYDISDAKRLHKVCTTMEGHGQRLQYSVFVCDLSDRERAMLVGTLTEIINHSEDSIMIVNLGSGEDVGTEKFSFLGRKKEIFERRAVVV